MNYKGTLVIILAIISVTSAKEWYQLNNPVFITSKNANKAIADSQTVKIIKFFTPWCRYCRYMKPIIDDFHKAIEEQQVTYVKFYQINCDQQTKLCKKFGVQSYPQIKVFGFDGETIGEVGGFQPKQKMLDYLYGLLQDLTSSNPQFFDNEEIVQRNDQKIEYQVERNFHRESKKKYPEDNKQEINVKNIKKASKQQQTKQVNSGLKSLTHEDEQSENKDEKVQVDVSNQSKGFQITITIDHILRVCLYVIIGAFGGYYLKDILKNYQTKLQTKTVSLYSNENLVKNPQSKQQVPLKASNRSQQ